jgi:hypothetical protein
MSVRRDASLGVSQACNATSKHLADVGVWGAKAHTQRFRENDAESKSKSSI